MKKFIKPAVILPIFIGGVVGTVLFILGDAGDAPGLCLIGIVTAYLLILWGIYNAEIIKRALLLPIILLSFGAGGILLSIAWLFDSEFAQTPSIPIVGFMLSLTLTAAGIFMLHRRHIKTP